MNFVPQQIGGSFRDQVAKLQLKLATAATKAITEVADDVKKKARANIASAGFSTGWQNAFRATVYPKGGKPSLRAAAHFSHKIPYFNVFETGASISGKPLMWLPLPNVPRGSRGNSQLSPKAYVQAFGPLVGGTSKSGTPILLGKITTARVTRASATSVRLRKPRKKGGKLPQVNVPLFVGVPTINIRKRFNVTEIIREGRAQLAAAFARNLK